MHWESNLAAVSAQMVTGGGHAILQETMSVLGVPTMTKKTFMGNDQSREGRKRLAEQRNDCHQGVRAITVIVDGGGLNAPTIIPIMLSLESLLSLDK